MSRKRYVQNTKYDEMAIRIYQFWNKNTGGFSNLDGKSKDYWRALAQTHEDFDKVLDAEEEFISSL
tara:strand:- start:18599 stop:18796 length:198 start_codon:yes stop_codon:yes gene_type:complete